jgi:GNAT superfamily N-acetyltransferase
VASVLDQSVVEHGNDEFVSVLYTDELARPLMEDLEREYTERYHDLFPEPARVELSRYPASDFAAPDGAFILLLRGNAAVSGGAFMRYDPQTAEFKRIWTHPEFRSQGLAKRVLARLEHEAIARGYSRVYLTTGPRQPEARRLYIGAGYTPLYDTTLRAEEVGIHAFEKLLPTGESAT